MEHVPISVSRWAIFETSILLTKVTQKLNNYFGYFESRNCLWPLFDTLLDKIGGTSLENEPYNNV